MGAVGVKRGVDMSQIDPEDYYGVARKFNISPAMCGEIAYMNDEAKPGETPEERWQRMRDWAAGLVL